MLTTVFLYRSKFNGILLPVFACPCWTLSRTLDWCCRSLWTIFVYENSEIMRQSVKKIIIIILTVFAWKYQTNIINRRPKQPQARTARTRFSVTTCLYLNPKNRARSLSTLKAVDAKTDTPHKVMDKDECSWEHISEILMSMLSARSIRVTMSGWEIRPTPRSVIAKGRQALKQQFCRRMNRNHFTKSNQDQNVAQRCRGGEKNIRSCYCNDLYTYVCRKQCLHHSDVFAFRQVHHSSCCEDEMPYFDCFTKNVLFRCDTQGFYVV